jgi:hypothetical protein
MRSRDGNRYRSLAICSIIFFNSLVLNASEYLVSYRYVVKNATIFNESLQISRAMKPCEGNPSSFIELPILKDDNLDMIIRENSLEFINFLHKIGLDLKYKSATTNSNVAQVFISSKENDGNSPS